MTKFEIRATEKRSGETEPTARKDFDLQAP